MKAYRAIYCVLLVVLLMPVLLNCKKQSIPTDALPIVTTHAVPAEIGAVSVFMGGEIVSEGSSIVTDKGVCVSTNQNPTLADNHYPAGYGKGGFAVWVAVSPGTTYYVRAYAINANGTAYGNQVTAAIPGNLPTVYTYIALTAGSTSAICGGTVLYDGGAVVTAHGFCWGTAHNPTINDNKTSDGSGLGFFVSTIWGFSPNTNYYFRAYATNSTGTSYGDEITFVLEQFNGPTVTDIDGNIYHTVTIGTQVWMVENLRTTKYRNGDPISNITEDLGMPKGIHGYSDYEHDPNYSTIYGRLYDWYVVTDSRGIAPEGWHVPSETEWTTLTDYLTNNGYGYEGSGDDIAKSMASKSGWEPYSFKGSVGNDQLSNNRSGFTALPGGGRFFVTGPHTNTGFYFLRIGIEGHWWSTTVPTMYGQGGSREIGYDWNAIGGFTTIEDDGYSVRCIKD